jgi:hypothetical protein
MTADQLHFAIWLWCAAVVFCLAVAVVGELVAIAVAAFREWRRANG